LKEDNPLVPIFVGKFKVYRVIRDKIDQNVIYDEGFQTSLEEFNVINLDVKYQNIYTALEKRN